MKNSANLSKGRIRVTSYGPFRGLKGTIQNIDAINDDLEEPFCFYLVSLEGTTIQESVWFEHDEIEFIDSTLIPSRPLADLTRN
jgi:hypothetical protein